MAEFGAMGGDGVSSERTPDTIGQRMADRFREAETKSFWIGPEAVSRRFAKIRQRLNSRWS